MATKKKTTATPITPKGEHDGGIGKKKKKKKKTGQESISVPKKIAKKDIPLKVNTSFENLLGMVINTPPKKKGNKK